MMETIIAGFTGSLITWLVAWIIHHKQSQAWQKEYRRLMGGISSARNDVINLSVHRATISENLDMLYRGK